MSVDLVAEAYERNRAKAQDNGHDEDPFLVEVQKLARLKRHEYDKIRRAEANRLGVRTATLDHAVEAVRSVERVRTKRQTAHTIT